MKNYLFLNNEYFDITIYQYGYEQCVPNHTFGPGMRNHYLIHCSLSGNGTYRTNDREREQEYHLHAGQAFLIEPNRLVHYFADGSTPWEYIWIEFDGMKAKEYLSEAGLRLPGAVREPALSDQQSGYPSGRGDRPYLLILRLPHPQFPEFQAASQE